MAMNYKEVLSFLFPEYQIAQSVKEKGFYSKKQRKTNVTKNVASSYNSGVYQQQVSNNGNNSQQLSQIADSSKASSKSNYTPTNDDVKALSKANEAFDGLSDLMKKYWVGSESERDAICKAFQRPFVRGFDKKKPKNTILLIGSESRGKTYAIKCISILLKQKKVIKHSDIAVLNFDDYTADSSNMLFLSDLYKALYSNNETIVFENIEKGLLSQIDILYQLVNVGSYKLTKRYMLNNGSLVESSGLLNTELISELSANGKYFVFTSTESQSKVISILGNKFIKEIGDVIIINPIQNDNVKDLAFTLCIKFVQKCKDNLHVNLEVNNDIFNEISSHYNENSGIKYLNEYVESKIYNPIAEMKLQRAISDDDSIILSYEGEYYAIIRGGNKLRLSDYSVNYGAMELDDVRAELNNVVGLSKVKEYVLNLENNYKVQKMRSEKGLDKSDVSMHMIFVGNPGTGKTTIARIVAKYLKAIGVLSSGHLCEVTRADLVGQYAGHTAIKTTEVIRGALGGVLFIDEAYSLVRDKHDIFGLEAIDALVKGIEDYRNDLVVILAGYEDEMNDFLKSNSGLKSRFPNIISFEDYSIDEMMQIANITASSKGYIISDSCDEGLRAVFEKSQIKGKNDSGNGRLVRNLIESAIVKQSQRIIKNPEDNMELLIPSDFGLDKKVEFNLEEQLSTIIGLEEVKKFVRMQYDILQAQKKRKEANVLVDTTQSLNMIFSGNPGTGKTTMARVVAEMLHSMDILKSGHLVETDKGGLISGYAGQTVQKTEEVFKSALGGVLFIDEAYSIASGAGSYGQECIDTLVKLIEDYRGEIVVILAGYSKEMNDFLKANSGLESRFPLKIDFPDYSASELYEIGKQMISSRGFTLDDDALKVFEERIVVLKKHSTPASGNGRMIRNFVEEIIRKQSARIAKSDDSTISLNEIIPSDIIDEKTYDNEFDLEKSLSTVIGLEPVKDYIRALNARLKLQFERKKVGLKTDNTQTMHMIFAGNPGTGKTMMARMVADVLYNLNVISSNKVIETDRSGLVAGYVGQTAIKTRQVIETAIGGVLFIDEAYALAQGGENDFGQEAIDTLVKMMDDNRDRLVVILAGYTEDMKRFLDKNAGLHSRFANIIEFPDYSTDELIQIAEGMYSKQGYVLSYEGKQELYGKIEKVRNNQHFGNGRYVRNIFEKSLNNQALRLSREKNYTKEALTTITAVDIKEA